MTQSAAARANVQDDDITLNLADDDDDGIVLDLSGIDENASGFSPLTKGSYPGVVESVEYAKSKSSGNPMLTWRLKVPYEGGERTLLYWTTMTEKTLPRMKKALMAVAGDLDLSNFRPKRDCAVLAGRACTVVVDIEKYQEELRNKVTDIKPPVDQSNEDLSFLDDLN